ncbi:hypothetical protein C8R44DRAFT_976338 [Mycena epipterygia]|nr:hypothetical protein C8R44DRAFT_976338 [Mycena epipterygia]
MSPPPLRTARCSAVYTRPNRAPFHPPLHARATRRLPAPTTTLDKKGTKGTAPPTTLFHRHIRLWPPKQDADAQHGYERTRSSSDSPAGKTRYDIGTLPRTVQQWSTGAGHAGHDHSDERHDIATLPASALCERMDIATTDSAAHPRAQNICAQRIPSSPAPHRAPHTSKSSTCCSCSSFPGTLTTLTLVYLPSTLAFPPARQPDVPHKDPTRTQHAYPAPQHEAVIYLARTRNSPTYPRAAATSFTSDTLYLSFWTPFRPQHAHLLTTKGVISGTSLAKPMEVYSGARLGTPSSPHIPVPPSHEARAASPSQAREDQIGTSPRPSATHSGPAASDTGSGASCFCRRRPAAGGSSTLATGAISPPSSLKRHSPAHPPFLAVAPNCRRARQSTSILSVRIRMRPNCRPESTSVLVLLRESGNAPSRIRGTPR